MDRLNTEVLAEISCGKISVGFPADCGGLPGKKTVCVGDGRFSRLCWIDRNGASREHDAKQNLFAGISSPQIRLNDFNLKGQVKLAVYSTRYGMPFYSFCYLYLSSSKDGKDCRRMEFLNDLEPDRAFIKFTCNFPD